MDTKDFAVHQQLQCRFVVVAVVVGAYAYLGYLELSVDLEWQIVDGAMHYCGALTKTTTADVVSIEALAFVALMLGLGDAIYIDVAVVMFACFGREVATTGFS